MRSLNSGFLCTFLALPLGLTSALAQVPPAERARVLYSTVPLVAPSTKGGGLEAKSIAPTPSTGDLPHQYCDKSPCDVHIQVWVDPQNKDGTGKTCAFYVPFVVVVKGKNTQIIWHLDESGTIRNARFRDDAVGEDGIRIYQSSSHYKNRVRQNGTFTLDRDDDVKGKARVLLYDINVDHDLGQGRCDVPDPIVVNLD